MNANDDGDIIAHRVDFRLIEQFQKLDSRYSVEKYNKLEQRLITRDVVVVEPSSSSSSSSSNNATTTTTTMVKKPTVVRRVRTTKIWWRRRRRHRRQRRRWRCRSIPEPTQMRNLKVWNWPRATNPRNTRLIYNGEFDIFFLLCAVSCGATDDDAGFFQRRRRCIVLFVVVCVCVCVDTLLLLLLKKICDSRPASCGCCLVFSSHPGV